MLTKFRPKTNLHNLMLMAARDLKNPAIAFGFDMADHALRRIALRAIELEDAVLRKN